MRAPASSQSTTLADHHRDERLAFWAAAWLSRSWTFGSARYSSRSCAGGALSGCEGTSDREVTSDKASYVCLWSRDLAQLRFPITDRKRQVLTANVGGE